MGILLLPQKKKVSANPVVQSLNLIYTPSNPEVEEDVPVLVDPSGVRIAFQSIQAFETEERTSRVAPANE
jgi:hypothetical protein